MYTMNDLCKVIAKINDALLEEGSNTLLEAAGRNGYYAIDEYIIDASGINRNICCGTARECSDAAWSYYNMIRAVMMGVGIVQPRPGSRDIPPDPYNRSILLACEDEK